MKVLEQKYNVAISLITGEPKKIGNLALTQGDILANISEYANYSPVGLKTKVQIINIELYLILHIETFPNFKHFLSFDVLLQKKLVFRC